MIELAKYVKINTESYPVKDGADMTHFMLEFYIRQNCYNINEKYGAYDGQVKFIVELSKYIYSQITNNKDNIKFEIDRNDLIDAGFINIFFDKITIYYGKHLELGYIAKQNNFNIKDKTLKNVTIYLNIKNRYDNIVTALIHELIHAWDDYNRYLNNTTTLYDICSGDYKRNIKELTTDNDWELLVKRIEYQLTNFEVNAYLSELTVTLYKSNTKIKNYKDALELFRNEDDWRNYTDLYNILGEFNETQRRTFTSTYNKLYNKEYTENKLFKKLFNRFERVIQKILSNVPKIYYDYATNNTITENRQMMTDYIKFLKNLKNYEIPVNFLKR